MRHPAARPDAHWLAAARTRKVCGMSTLEGQVALVTGSSRGIGEAVVSELARRGAAVAVHGRDQAAVSEVATAIRHEGGKAIAVTCDVTSFDQLEAIRHQIEESLGPVDILVANAGGSFTPPAPLEEIPEEGWRATIDGNLLATFLTLKSFLPGMKKRAAAASSRWPPQRAASQTAARQSPTVPPRPPS